MKKLNSVKKLGRTKSHRNSLLANLATSLFLHKRILTTETKAKAMRGFVEKIITKSKKGTSAVQREVFKKIKNKDAMKALFSEISQKSLERQGGYTRVIKLPPRLGDAAKMAFIELVDFFASTEKINVEKKQDRAKRLKGTKKLDTPTEPPENKKNKKGEPKDNETK